MPDAVHVGCSLPSWMPGRGSTTRIIPEEGTRHLKGGFTGVARCGYGGLAHVTVASNPPGRTPMIEAKNLTKRYGDKVAVDDLSFTVEPGTVTGFLGPNGAGKSTTMRLL